MTTKKSKLLQSGLVVLLISAFSVTALAERRDLRRLSRLAVQEASEAYYQARSESYYGDYQKQEAIRLLERAERVATRHRRVLRNQGKYASERVFRRLTEVSRRANRAVRNAYFSYRVQREMGDLMNVVRELHRAYRDPWADDGRGRRHPRLPDPYYP